MCEPDRDAFRRLANGTLPRMGSVDGFAVHLEPSAQGLQAVHLHVGNRAVSFGPDVQQKVAVLAYDVNQQINEFGRLDRFGFAFGAIVAEGSSQAATLFPFLRINLLQSLIFR